MTSDKITLDLKFVRKEFPALQSGFVFMDNAGGSQTLRRVMDRTIEYFLHYNVQLGASYPVSANAGKVLRKTHKRLARLIHAQRPEEVVIGPSTTMLLRILSLCISQQWKKGDEVIVTNSDHEANVSCWMDLEKKGIKVKIWKLNPSTLEFDLNDLSQLLSKKTKLVAMVHASNILGTINPVQDVARLVHQAGALLCVDGVAYAPHRLIDVQAFDADFYVFSWYKVYGPHQAVLYGRYDLLKNLESINHYFIGKDAVPYKLQPGNFNFEQTYSLNGICDYLSALHKHHYGKKSGKGKREKYKKCFQLLAEHEDALARPLLQYLSEHPDIRILGHPESDRNKRVPTISFVHQKMKSSEIVEKMDPNGIGIRFGDFYAKKLIEDLDLVAKDGIVRVSLVHYNTMKEVNKLISAFQKIF